MRGLSLLLAAWLIIPAASAGDLTALPTTDAGFQEKIGAFIKPGSNTEEALLLLEAHRFECRVFDHHKHPLYHCSRMDEPRFYQVMIESKGAVVKTVEPSIGMLRR